jgi:hypothetical protein
MVSLEAFAGAFESRVEVCCFEAELVGSLEGLKLHPDIAVQEGFIHQTFPSSPLTVAWQRPI